MVETFDNLFPRIASFGTLYGAYERAARGHRFHPEMMRFRGDLEPNLIAIQESLLHRSWRTGPYRHFEIYEPKKRDVAALPVKDRIVHHALVSVIEPIWEARFCRDSFACRAAKGTHAGVNRAQEYLRRVKRDAGHVFALKADIAKYFASIQHDALKRLLRRHIACEDTLWLLNEIIDSTAEPGDLLPRGIPLGNLTSQLFANIYLHELDQFAKQELRLPYYLRYMDDFVVLGPEKETLHQVRRQMEDFLWANLGLRTNAKTQVFPVDARHGRALDFLGYRLYPTHRKLRRDSVIRVRRRLKALAKAYAAGQIGWEPVRNSVTAWVGHARHADTYNLRRRVLHGVVFRAPKVPAGGSASPC